jgi:hypothetical protein
MDVARMIAALFSELEQIEQDIRCLEKVHGERTQAGSANRNRNQMGADSKRDLSVN